MTPTDRATLRAACESAFARAKTQQAQPVVPLLPAGMVLGLLDAADAHAALLQHFAYYTEVQLATQEGAEMRKATPKIERERQARISANMVQVCRDFGVTVPVYRGGPIPRGGGSRLRRALGQGDDT